MDVEQAIDIGREAINMALLLAAPVLLIGVVVGLGVGLLQALTQVQDQTVIFVPKIILMILAASLTLPWLIEQMVDYTTTLISGIPQAL